MAEWYERFFDGLYRQVLPNTFEPARTLEQARAIKRMLGVRRGARVLDVPCGMGRLTIPLSRMGLQMTGVDRTAAYVRRARREATQAHLDIRFLRCDMREIDFDGEFDAAFNWFGSFGYFSDRDNLAFCRRVCRALRGGGRFLIEGLNRSWLRTHWRPRLRHNIHGVRISTINRWDERTSRVVSTWSFRKGRRRERHVIRMWIFNGAQIRALLRAAGFGEVRLYGRPPRPFGRFSRHSRRIIAVARRPG
jgi:SAM-dependent methyltransferase